MPSNPPDRADRPIRKRREQKHDPMKITSAPGAAIPLATILLFGWLSNAAAAKPPNIVVILTDDQGYADISLNPHHPPEVATPHMDALARDGCLCHDRDIRFIRFDETLRTSRKLTVLGWGSWERCARAAADRNRNTWRAIQSRSRDSTPTRHARPRECRHAAGRLAQR